MKLHLGCGNKIINGYINIDVRENLSCDLISDVRKLEQFKNGSIDEIYASHVLEHFGRHEYKLVLKRWFELLKKGGTLKLAVPDIGAVIDQYNRGAKLKSLWGLLYGGQTYENNYHYIGFDFETLKSDLEEIGFTNINLWDWRSTDHSYIDDYSQCYLPHMDKINGDLMSLNVISIK
jgi:predicted SAM-dependent methyltransferase